ncbi:MAG: peptidoglycan-binding protein [Clostridia bacterium]|nr:peptidoglycan-binding protein [Clostridia bacterium]
MREKKSKTKSPSLVSKTMLLTCISIVLVFGCLLGLSLYARANIPEVAAEPISAELPTPTPVIETAAPSPTATFEVYATSEPMDAIAVSQYFTLMIGDDNTAVAALLERLTELGYIDSDEPSTVFNEATEAAVCLFQRSLGLEMNGIADSALQDVLFSDDAPTYQVKLFDTGSDIRSIQSRLSELGYYSDRLSGYYGPKTEEAVMMFQLNNSLEASGIFTFEDWQVLFSSEAQQLVQYDEVTPSPTPSPTPRTSTRTTAPSAASSSGSKTPTPAATSGSGTPTPTAASETTPTASSGIPVIDETAAATATPASGSSGGTGSYSSSASGLISCANAQMGKKYVWGDEGPNTFDCSGLVYYCLRSCGVSTSRLSAKSFSQKSSWTLIESIDDLQAGDLVFFKSDSSSDVNHTGIYIGSGRFIHASSSAGEVVRSSFSSDDTKYWNRNFVCGRRVFG